MATEEIAAAIAQKAKAVAGFALIFVMGFASGYYYIAGNEKTDVLTIKDNGGCSGLLKQDPQPVVGQDGTAAKTVSVDNAGSGSAEQALSGSPLSNSGALAAVKAFAASKNSTIYHTKDCPYVKQIKLENLVWYSSQAQAQAAGKKAHSCVKETNN